MKKKHISTKEKLNYLINNYKNLNLIDPLNLTYSQYKEIEECLLNSGLYKTNKIDQNTIENLVLLLKNIKFKKNQVTCKERIKKKY